jgi:F-type H+-transporting ATPase subunit delta
VNGTSGPLPRIYAGALFDLASEADAAAERRSEVEVLLDVLRSEESLGAALNSPKIEAARKAELVRSTLGGRLSRELVNLVLLLIQKNRQALLPAILEEFIGLYEEEEGRLRGRVTTAVPLERGEAERLVRGLSESVGKDVVLEEVVDPGILGGAVLRLGDVLVDGSVRARLRALKDRLRAAPEA